MADPARPRISFRLLGPFSVWKDDRTMDRNLGLPARLLLISLLTQRDQRQRREALMEQIWPEGKAPSRKAFNTVLWRLRQFLEALDGVTLSCEKDSLRLRLADNATVDCDTLQYAASAIPEDLAEATAAQLADLDAAVASWRGPFSEGQYEDWVLVQRERYHNLLIQSLGLLMRAAGQKRQFERALDYGLRILAQDPFRENVHCEVMWLCVLTGQRARALTLHSQFCAALQSEMGIGSMPETRALAEYIRTGLETAPTNIAPSEIDKRGSRLQAPVHRYESFLSAVERSRADVYRALQELHPAN
ncbi:AfsR/SARP family transcriptional regulator [Palleronia caenipelagi]|uniref:Bacterial transcriptional activator domain-containing protein n=1 Tax=Palleronia caenipelagi TaxID=2489174 RepID=A0A547PPS7_9RHOB|nr:BTAD domain-containing putative transcriptional regulator [Palleronia caenipelagi]TRD16120.1 hypothetical protein FEV53_14645 [Palleronia caenipelagi]